MLANLFYFCGLFLFLFNFKLLLSVGKIVKLKEFVKKFQKVTNKSPEKENFSGTDYETFNFFIMTNFLTISWYFLGTIGSNWVFFLSFLILNPILSLISNSTAIKPISFFFDLVILLLNLALIGFLVFNHFHLHLNPTKILLP